MKRYVLWILAASVIVPLLFWWIKKVSAKYDEIFLTSLLRNVAQWLDHEELMDKDRAMDELQRMLDGKPSDSFRDQLLRLECKFQEVTASDYKVITTVIFKKGDARYEGKITNEIKRSHLPTDVRKEFISQNPGELTYDLLNRTGKTNND